MNKLISLIHLQTKRHKYSLVIITTITGMCSHWQESETLLGVTNDGNQRYICGTRDLTLVARALHT